MMGTLGAPVSLALLGAALLVALVRALRGPSTADRVVVLDLMGMLAIGLVSFYLAYGYTGGPFPLDGPDRLL